jgi:methionyl-tRNA formyltransferase
MRPLKLAFMGTPDFALPSLHSLLQAGHELRAVYCQPPRPAGRGKKLRPSPVQRYAEEMGLEVRHPESLKGEAEQAAFAALDLDAAVVAAYGLILPKAILQAPRLGCLNVHASLLPRWRGAAPIQRALLEGDNRTGVTIMQMDEGLDTGGILLSEATQIVEKDTGERLHDRLALMGGPLVVRALAGLEAGELSARPQPEDGVTYAAKLTREEAKLDWSQPAERLERLVRAFTPWPGAWFEAGSEAGGERIRVLRAELAEGEGAPGELLDERLTIACGEGALRLTEVQRAGKAAMAAEAFLRGFAIKAGSRLS